MCECECGIGRSWQDKVGGVRKEVGLKGATSLVVTAMDEIACECVFFCMIVFI